MSIKKLLKGIRERWNARFAFLRWPLSSLHERVLLIQDDGLINSRAAKKRYPIRAVRYWWARCALLEELRNRNEETVVADIGCNKGHIRRFVGDIPKTKWVGLDWKIDGERLRQGGYAGFHECDFDQPLPLSDKSVDIIVFLHVIEHLPRPAFTITELSRILRPGGLLLAGSPVAPRLIARFREWQLRARLKKRTVKVGGHINSMDCRRWRRLVENSGMSVDILTGTFLARWSANPLENQAWWVRFNQLWGAIFPSLGGEVCLSARRNSAPCPQTAPCRVPTTRALPVWRPAWAWASVVLLVCIGSWGVWSSLKGQACPVHTLATQHQDGNDVFYVLDHPAFVRLQLHNTVKKLRHHHKILFQHAEETGKGIDAHFLVSSDSLPSLNPIMQQLNLRIAHEVTIDGHRFALLSSEDYGQSGSRG